VIDGFRIGQGGADEWFHSPKGLRTWLLAGSAARDACVGCKGDQVFAVVDRETLRERLIEAGRVDPRVSAVALLGSAARGEEDRWSDIDLALRLEPGTDPAGVADAWTLLVAETEPVVDQLDIRAAGAFYRVLLLSSTLQVDLSFWPHDQTLAGGAPVKVLLGEVEVAPVAPADDDESVRDVRMAWLYALHVRAALRRGRAWQALWMLEGIRNLLVGLYCRRLGLPENEGRGVDRLPPPILVGLASTVPVNVDTTCVSRCFASCVELLVAEVACQGLPVAAGLGRVLDELVVDSRSE
jgi:predicted nucleotidyltransferase